MYTVDPSGDLVGYSAWPWDPVYAPVVGCFVEGRLKHVAPCDLQPQEAGIEGPEGRCWFRMPVEGGLARMIEADRGSVALMRLEDGEPVRFRQEGAPEPKSRSVEEIALLGRGPARPQDGFASFLTLPVAYQLEVVFLDLLRRWPDPQARVAYLEALSDGRLTVLQVRNQLMQSSEFWAREFGLGQRVGGLLTAGVWKSLTQQGLLVESYRPLKPFRVASHAELPTPDYVSLLYRTFLGREADPAGLKHYSYVADAQGRAAVALELSREAAHRGLLVTVVED